MKKMTALTATLFGALCLLACTPNPDNGEGKEPEPSTNPYDEQIKDTTVEIYNYAPNAPRTAYYAVSVQGKGKPQDCYVFPVGKDGVGASNGRPYDIPHIATFGADGMVRVEIIPLQVVPETVEVLPGVKEYPNWIEDGKVVVYLSEGDKASVVINGDLEHPVFLFVHSLETDKPSKDDPNVIYFEAGKIHDRQPKLIAKSNQTIYIEGGAIVLGAIYIQDAENVTIAGHGIMDDYHSFQDPSCWGMRLYRCKNTTVKDILLANMHGWSTYAVECEDVTFDNYKVVAAWNEYNNTGVENDGMGVMCGKRIKFLNTFSYSHDDTYVIKSGKWSYKGEVEDVLYDGCMAWNRWGGNAFEIGYEVPYNISNIRYRNCYVLRSAISIGYTFRHGAMAIHNSGKGTVSNVSYETMHIDNPDEFGIYFSIIKSSYTLPDGEVWGPGNINGVTMKNIYMYNTPPYGNILFGYDKDHTVKNISIENLVIDGKKCMSIKDANFTVDQAQAKVSYPVPDSEVTFQ